MDRLECDRMFVAVMEQGSFVAAAARLGTSSGQASKLVARLEEALGVRLLNRTTRAVSATEAGRAYLERLRPLLDEFAALDASLRDIGQTPRGQIRLSAPLTFGTLALPGVLTDFALRYPQIGLDVSFNDRMVHLVDEGFDAAIRIGRPGDSSLISRKLCDMGMRAVASKGYLAARGVPETPQSLTDHDCILDKNFRDPERWSFGPGPQMDEAPAKGVTVQVSGRLRFSNAEVCLNAAEAGLGIAYLPAFVATTALAEGRVVEMLKDHAAPPMGVYVLYPHSRHLATKVRVLVDHLADHFRGGGQAA